MQRPTQGGYTGNKLLVQLFCGEIEAGPPVKIWFRVTCPSDPRLTSYFQDIPNDMKFFSKSRVWNFDFKIYDEFAATLESSQFSSFVHLCDLPRFLVKALKSIITLPPTIDDVNLPESMLDTLLPFQLEALEFVIRRKGRAMIADEMVI